MSGSELELTRINKAASWDGGCLIFSVKHVYLLDFIGE